MYCGPSQSELLHKKDYKHLNKTCCPQTQRIKFNIFISFSKKKKKFNIFI